MAVAGQSLRNPTATMAPEREVLRAKAQLKAGLLMGLESCSVRAEQMARQLLIAGRLMPLEEIIGRVDEVSSEKIRALAEHLLSADAPSVAVVGAGRRSKRFADAAAGISAGYARGVPAAVG